MRKTIIIALSLSLAGCAAVPRYGRVVLTSRCFYDRVVPVCEAREIGPSDPNPTQPLWGGWRGGLVAY